MSVIIRLVTGVETAELSVDTAGIFMGIIVLCLTQFFVHGAQLEKDVDGLILLNGIIRKSVQRITHITLLKSLFTMQTIKTLYLHRITLILKYGLNHMNTTNKSMTTLLKRLVKNSKP